MSLLQSITTGKTDLPPRVVIQGENGVGKSSFGAGTPNPIFVQTEDGLGQLPVSKFPLAATFDDAMSQLAAVRDEPHEFRTVVVDSLDWLERLIFDKVCNQFGASNIEKADGGYGRGYVHALGHWRKFLALLDEIRARRRMVVLLISHTKVERVENPEGPAYDRYCPRLHKLAAALVCEWCDIIGFATRRMRVDKESGKATPIGADGGQRILRCIGGPACVAKSRYALPAEIELSWNALVDAIGKGAARG